MNILIVAATWDEIRPTELFLQQADEAGKLSDHAIDLCITGVGGVATAYKLGKQLQTGNWDFAWQLGVTGSFTPDLPLRSVVVIEQDCFADLGAEDNQTFIDVFEMGLHNPNQFPFTHGKIYSGHEILENKLTPPAQQFLAGLPKARAISVNTVHGNTASIAATLSKFNPQTESMEGAAFFYCCRMAAVPCLQMRAVSNFVVKRDKSTWDLSGAVQALNQTAITLLKLVL